MKLNLLGISASPRGKANSYYLLTQAMQAVRESEPEAEITVYDFKNKTFGGCIHCYGCRKKATRASAPSRTTTRSWPTCGSRPTP